MSTINRNSFEGSETDLTALIAEFPDGDELPGQMMIVKKLSDAFEDCLREGENICSKADADMKVYLRLRPIAAKLPSENTIIVDSGETSNSLHQFLEMLYYKDIPIKLTDQTITTIAPDSSRRAQYTKLEERKYVRNFK